MTRAVTTVSEIIARSRRLWGGICWTVTVVTAGFGVPLAIGGPHVVPLTAAYAAIVRYVPGGIHTYGVAMLVFAVAFLTGLMRPVVSHEPMPERWLHVTLAGFSGFAVGVVTAFAASWWLTGVPTWQAIIYWAALGGLAMLAARETPDPGGTAGAQ